MFKPNADLIHLGKMVSEYCRKMGIACMMYAVAPEEDGKSTGTQEFTTDMTIEDARNIFMILTKDKKVRQLMQECINDNEKNNGVLPVIMVDCKTLGDTH